MAPRATQTAGACARKASDKKVMGSRVTKGKSKAAIAGRGMLKNPSGAETGYEEDEAAAERFYEGEVAVGGGTYRGVFRNLTVKETHDDLVKISKIVKPKDRDPVEHFQKLKMAAQNYEILKESTVIESSDGVKLVYYIKGGMLAGLSPEQAQRQSDGSLQAINNLLAAQPPETPGQKNTRYFGDAAQIRKRWAKRAQKWGELIFAYWHEQGGTAKPAKLSRVCYPEKAAAVAAQKSYFKDTAWEHHQVSRWIKALEPASWKEQNDFYQRLRDKNKLDHFDQGREGCHTSLALLINVAVGPHRDDKDVPDNLTAINCWGECEGGDQVFTVLERKIHLEPGDLVLARYALLEHFLEDITGGYRYAHVRFTRANILRPLSRIFECKQGDCNCAYSSIANLKSHWRGTQKKPKHSFTAAQVHEMIVSMGYSTMLRGQRKEDEEQKGGKEVMGIPDEFSSEADEESKDPEDGSGAEE